MIGADFFATYKTFSPPHSSREQKPKKHAKEAGKLEEREFAALFLWMVEQAPEREKMQALLFRILNRLFGER